MIVKLNAIVVPSDQNPLPSVGAAATLWDADSLVDDLLCSSEVGEGGRIEFIFDLTEGESADSPVELYPDLYLKVVEANGTLSFHSEVLRNTDFLKIDPVSRDRVSTLTLAFKDRR